MTDFNSLHQGSGMERETATRNPRSDEGRTEHHVPDQSFPDNRSPEQDVRQRHPEPPPPQTPSAPPQQWSRTAVPLSVSLEFDADEPVLLSPRALSARRLRAQRRLEEMESDLKAGRGMVRIPRRAVPGAGWFRRCKRSWSRSKATLQVILCLIRGISPDTVRPCSPAVMRIYRLRKGGRA